jgi:hypothetical protein
MTAIKSIEMYVYLANCPDALNCIKKYQTDYFIIRSFLEVKSAEVMKFVVKYDCHLIRFNRY